jgi:hypothetical protein
LHNFKEMTGLTRSRQIVIDLREESNMTPSQNVT